MSLQGLPDFQRPIHGLKYEIYFPYENAGSFVIASSALEIATTASGRPDFLLEFVRGVTPGLPPAPYAFLDFRVKATHPIQDALAQLREHHAAATVMAPVLRGGFLRMQPGGNTGDVSTELLAPMPLSANGLGSARFAIRLGPAGGAVIEGALKGEVLGLVAWAEMEIEGVAPRVPVRVRFSPADVLNALARLSPDAASPVLTRDQVEHFFEQDIGHLPLTIDGAVSPEMHRDLVETLADHVRVAYGDFVASPRTPVEASMALRMSEARSGAVTWDLSQPLAAPRALVAALDPFEAARLLVTREGITAVVKQTVVPPLAIGTRRVHVSANLPPARAGVITLGVDIDAPENPPRRLQAVHQTVELVAPADAGVAVLRLSAAEPAAYRYTTWAIVERSGTVERLKCPAAAHEGETLDLSVNDFPLRFLTIGASEAVLDLATVTGVFSGQTPAGRLERGFELTSEVPELGIAMPVDAAVETVAIEAHERNGSKVLRLTLPGAQSTRIDLSSFAEFGSHRVVVQANFGGTPGGLLAVDLVPEGQEDQPQAIETLALTTSVAMKEWRYMAMSPFRSGYRYRRHADSGVPVEPWSDVRLPDVPLRLGAVDLAAH
jgi:hypothetical protein